MSNPVITFTNIINLPSDPSTVRKTYTMKAFDSIDFFLYNSGEDSSTYDPTDMGQEFYIWSRVEDEVLLKPAFVTEGSWTSMKASPSGFITPNNSVMPKLIGPSILLVDNGIKVATDGTTNTAPRAKTYEISSTSWKDGFNWWSLKVNDADVGGSWYKYFKTGSNAGTQYVSAIAKKDGVGETKVEMTLLSPDTTFEGDWDATNLVVGGAFSLALNLTGITPGKTGSVEGSSENQWSFVVSFGDVTMTFTNASTMNVNIAGDGVGGNDTLVNLAEGAAKESPPQVAHMGKPPILINVYPCWNGIIVSSGHQDSPNTVRSAGTFCRKIKSASIQSDPYSTWFDPTNPDNVEVETDGGATVVDFGTQIDVVAKNCLFDIAYLPRFFIKSMALDGWFLFAIDTSESTYTYDLYTIYTKNNDSDWDIATPVPAASGFVGTAANTEYYYVPWSMSTTSEKHKRHAGELFAYILETKEARTSTILNNNGSFDIEWTGGTPGETGATDWTKFIKSVSVTIDKDGSTGSMEIDKYGIAGQEAVATQRIGAVVLSATGGVGTVAGDIFYGLGMGIAESNVSGGATWTVPLIGLEKKMDDIALINPPFMDGETLSSAVDYLCRYSGIIYDMSYANSSVVLSATEEVNSARFDWKSGTSVKTALDDVVEDVNHTYVVRDGKIFFYELGIDGLPITLGPDRSIGYVNTNIVAIDKTPDFDNLRNYVVAMSLQSVSDGKGTQTSTTTFPLIQARTKVTTPYIPWAKCLVQGYPGVLDESQLSVIADNLDKISSVYDETGRLTIPGNAGIKPFDRWGSNYAIKSVTHNVDLDSKTWTTDLEFMKISF